MGTVYKGLQISMEREVAVKILDKSVSVNPQLVQRFIRECKAVARLNHENIVAGIDAGSTPNGIYYFVMEFIKGQSLGVILQKQGKLTIRRALNITLQITNALEYARKQGIIHRDIKPDNIMVTDEGNAKLCDLGLVREVGKKSALTIVGHAIGTPHNTSLRSKPGPRECRYQSGYLLAWCFVVPYGDRSGAISHQNAAVVCTLHATKPLPSARKIEPSVPVEVNAIIQKCTQKQPEKRYQIPGELANDLQSYLAHLSILEQGKHLAGVAAAVAGKPIDFDAQHPEPEMPNNFASKKLATTIEADTVGIDFLEDAETKTNASPYSPTKARGNRQGR